MKRYDHEKLGITFQELGALLGVRELLASGSVVHVTYGTAGGYEFNMRTTCRTERLCGSCGTVACIGGTMAMIMAHTNMGAYVADGGYAGYNQLKSGPLKALFYPDHGDDGKLTLKNSDDWDRITPTAAVHAINAFLAGRAINWRTLVGKYGLSDAQLKAKRRLDQVNYEQQVCP